MQHTAQQFQVFDLHRMFVGEQAGGLLYLLEVAFRTGVMYLYVLLFARVVGQRAVGQISPFEFILVIAVSSAAGDPMLYPHVPILHGVAVITVVMLLHRIFGRAASRSERVEDVMEGEPLLVVRDGRVVEGALGGGGLSRRELMMLLRVQGHQNVGEIEKAFFEPSGQISTFPFPPDQRKDTQSTAPQDSRTPQG
jgi:uncharacterized membrane protein YcaP (DUF421 family)